MPPFYTRRAPLQPRHAPGVARTETVTNIPTDAPRDNSLTDTAEGRGRLLLPAPFALL